MYVIPLIFIILIALAIFFSPILAVILLVVALIGIGAVKFFGRGVVDAERAESPAKTPPSEGPGRHFTENKDEDEKTGLWGEQWPEERSGESSSS